MLKERIIEIILRDLYDDDEDYRTDATDCADAIMQTREMAAIKTALEDDTRWFAPADVRPVSDDPFIAMRAIRVVFDDAKYNFETDINGTRAEICRYYDRPIDRSPDFHVEELVRPIAIEFLHDDPDKTIRADYARE